MEPRDMNEEVLDDGFVKSKQPFSQNEKWLLRFYWGALFAIVLGAVFRLFHFQYSMLLLFSGGTLISGIGVIRFAIKPHKNTRAIVNLVVSLLIGLWVFSNIYPIPFRQGLEYATIGAIILRSFFFRNSEYKI